MKLERDVLISMARTIWPEIPDAVKILTTTADVIILPVINMDGPALTEDESWTLAVARLFGDMETQIEARKIRSQHRGGLSELRIPVDKIVDKVRFGYSPGYLCVRYIESLA